MRFNKGDVICRKGRGCPEGVLVCDRYDETGRLLAHPVDGGVQLTIAAHEQRRFRLMAEGEREEPLFSRGMFALAECERVFDGWSNGQLWKGWEKPRFEFEVGREILEWMGDGKGRYDDDRDVFITVNQYGEEDVWPAENIAVTDGSRTKVYGLGSGSWKWECAG